ncbi:ImmA/IrrE family metallo-endopeptidase [Corynebacterium tuberculostearicum]|uniref:ImmA/IrrE family metallo-endopeptidase n=1 Tax=Corynebacterium tuberculostearicum TaxID=38304 RepID=UPI002648998D|nr:ImmA/IrrE family metallo-endopeptidase [Corynebacterium tuberculostearicum]MDV2432837.1 ImmA/IrrE family metallo-endopeptidase [Corynebacterium tuberculostearicum]WKE59028.1 ImmA/IrrE family metallo-endopeptidase [Corynebacterium tuberculostearicum]
MLGTEPVRDINALMKLIEADFIVLELPSGLDALTLRDPASGALTVGIGMSSNPYRQRFTVAHEIGHIIAGDITEDGASLLCDTTHPSETRANTFARCVLCPVEALHDLPPTSTPEELLSDVVQRFQVSPTVAAIQLCQAELISEETKEELKSYSTKRLASQFGWKANYDYAAKISELPRSSERLVADAYKAYNQGLIALPSVAFAEQVSIEEVIESTGGAQHSPTNGHAGSTDIEADLADFFADE